MLDWVKQIPSFIYDFVISRFLTITSHILMLNFLSFKPSDKLMLDVGCGTGKPLNTIIPKLPQQMNVIGIDIDPAYVMTSKALFKNSQRVTIQQLSFYDVNKLQKKYDIVFFSFSFMLMPDKEKALRLAETILSQNGRIIFLLTLNKHRFPILEKIKPLIHKLTSIDFGQVVYYDEFMKIIDQSKLKILKKQRLHNKWNPLFWVFPIHYVEIGARELRQPYDVRTPEGPETKEL